MAPDGKSLAMDTPEFLAAMSWVRDIFMSKSAPAPGPDATTTGNTNNELFGSSRLAMLQTQYTGQFTPGEKVIQGKFKWNVGAAAQGSSGQARDGTDDQRHDGRRRLEAQGGGVAVRQVAHGT